MSLDAFGTIGTRPGETLSLARPPEGSADALSGVEYLLRVVDEEQREHDRGSATHKLSVAVLEGQIAVAEEHLEAAKLRNADLAYRAGVLERALQQSRARSAQATWPSPWQDRQEEPAAGEAAQPLAGWRRLAARVPPVRKRPVRERLLHTLRTAGLDHVEAMVASMQSPGASTNPWHMLNSSHGEDGGGSRAEPKRVVNAIPRLFGAPTSDTLVDSAPPSARHASSDAEAESGRESHFGGRSRATSTVVPVGAWRHTATLCSHLDGVRAVACNGDVLLSCGEDAVVKAWDLTSTGQYEDLEPLATYRGATSALLSLACRRDERAFFTGGRDAEIRAFRALEPSEYDPYDPTPATGRAVGCVRTLSGHTDAVWSLGLHPHVDVLASAAADGTIRLWNTRAEMPSGEVLESEVLTRPAEGDAQSPTSVVWAPHLSALLLGGFASSLCVLFDVEKGVNVRTIEAAQPGDGAAGLPAVTSVAFHGSMDLAVAGHTDNCARLFSPSTGLSVMRLAHGDIVTSVAIDPTNGCDVVTGSHDGCVRVFDIRNGHCLQELPLHRQKYDESVHCVCHAGDRIVTAGADATVVVLGRQA